MARAEIQNDTEPSVPTAALLSQIANLQAELHSLGARYDTLLEAKNRAAARYKVDYKKWRDFKRWLFQDVKKDDDVKLLLTGDELDAYKRASALGKRKQFEELGPSLEYPGGEDSTSDVEEDKRSSSRLRHQRSKSYHGEPSQKTFSPSSSNKNTVALPAPTSDKPSVKVVIIESPRKEESYQPALPSTEPRKTRGRYAQVPAGMDPINSRFSIRKDRNDGVNHQYDAVVRNREERKHMLGEDCECCREYYRAVGPLPASRQPLWRSPKRKTPYGHHLSNNDKENADEVVEHMQRISRHRHHWHRAKTPPGYWDIGFPDTQEASDINRRAAEMHKRKLINVEVEARNTNGRYMEHAPRTP
ncbi:DNA repair protein endonuclease SAE2/CtIP C-terminus-domain-containing protein [Melanogaster broomeanus]|nr:DNA repair protein endonuclease SAE2/CtIP C-terminus-domain-containing protein [Melanogaster broomeanus]